MSILQTLQVRIVDEAERLGPAELVLGILIGQLLRRVMGTRTRSALLRCSCRFVTIYYFISRISLLFASALRSTACTDRV